MFPLQHQHADIGSQLTWRCEAKAVPSAIYFWHRNGVELIPVPGEIDIQQNVMIIHVRLIVGFKDTNFFSSIVLLNLSLPEILKLTLRSLNFDIFIVAIKNFSQKSITVENSYEPSHLDLQYLQRYLY